MAKTATVQVRMEPELKKEVETVLAGLGLNATTAVRMLFRHIANQREIPIDLREPNDGLLAAMQEARDPEFLGKARSYDTVDEMFSAILGVSRS